MVGDKSIETYLKYGQSWNRKFGGKNELAK